MTVIIKPYNFKSLRGAQDGENLDSIEQLEFSPLYQEDIEVTYTKEQLQASEEDGYQRGLVDGVNQGRKEVYELTQKTNDILNIITPNLNQLFANLQNNIAMSASETSKLALQIAQKIAGQSLQENPMQLIEPTINKCLEILFNESRLLICVHNDVVKDLEAKIADIVQKNEFNGTITIEGNAQIPVGDCKIQWKEGAAEMSQQKRLEQIQEVINNMSQLSS